MLELIPLRDVLWILLFMSDIDGCYDGFISDYVTSLADNVHVTIDERNV